MSRGAVPEAGSGSATVRHDAELRVGAATRDITPQGPQWLDGFGVRTSRSEGAYLPIQARGLALRLGDAQAILVAAEVLGFDRTRTAELKSRIAVATGVPEPAIILAATHTHCAPRVCEMVMPGEVDPDYRRQFEEACVAVAVAARAALAPALVSFSRTEDRLGVNRRYPENGGVTMRPHQDGPRDTDVDTLWFADSAVGTPIASLTVAACHPTSRGGPLIGGDYPGFLCRELERRVGGVAMFVLGCAGDVRPAFTDERGGFRMAELAEVERAGQTMAEAVLAARAKPRACATGNLEVRRTCVEMPLAELPTEEELRRVAQEDELPLRRQWAGGLLGREAIPTSVSFELQRLSLAPGAEVLFLPGEVASEYALWLKGLERARENRPLMIAAYANGAVGYVPSRAMLPLGGYEVNGSHFYYNLPAPYARDLEVRLRKAVCELMDIKPDGTEAGSIY